MLKINLLKCTVGNNGVRHYFEALSTEEDINDVQWFIVDESYFEFMVNKFKHLGSRIERDEKGEIIYLEYKSIVPRKLEAY